MLQKQILCIKIQYFWVGDLKANKIFKIAFGTKSAQSFISNVLDSDAITVPRIEFIPEEQALLVSTIENLELWNLSSKTKEVFAKSYANEINEW